MDNNQEYNDLYLLDYDFYEPYEEPEENEEDIYEDIYYNEQYGSEDYM